MNLVNLTEANPPVEPGFVGYACISLQRPPKGSKSIKYKAGLSFCSPSDVEDSLGRLNKKKARMIADGRRRCNRPGRSITLSFPRKDGFNLRDVHEAVLEHVLHDATVKKNGHDVPYAPKWVRQAIFYGAKFKFHSNKHFPGGI